MKENNDINFVWTSIVFAIALIWFVRPLIMQEDAYRKIEGEIASSFVGGQHYHIVLNTSSPEGVLAFIADVFTHTEKKYVRSIYYINFKGDVIERTESYVLKSGFPGTFDFRLYKDSRFNRFIELLRTREVVNRQLFDDDPIATQRMMQIFESNIAEFLEDESEGEPIRIDHGLNEYFGSSSPDIRRQFVEWYLDDRFRFALPNNRAPTRSPSGTSFYAGVNQVVYNRAINRLVVLSVALAPIGLDWIAEGAGAIYAGFHGNWLDASLFGAAALIPVVDGRATHVTRNMARRGRTIFSGTTQNNVQATDFVEFFGRGVAQGSIPDNVFIGGWTRERILALPRGSRPNPTEYLSPDFIATHLRQFEGGVTKITAYAPSGRVGPPGGTFVLPRNKADDLIRQANNDIHRLEDLLGLNRGDLGSNPFRSDVRTPSGLRMPSGNELGVNENWIPGGRTSGGILEAVVDSFEPGTYISTQIFR